MPLTLDSGMAAHIAQDTATLAFIFRLVYQHPINGATTVGFTTAGVDLTISGVSYPVVNGVTPSTITSLINKADKFDLSGPIGTGGITESDILAGLYDFADIEVYVVNWADPTMTAAYWGKYKIGSLAVSGREWTMECSDILDQLSQEIIEVTSPSCRVELFSTRCQVRSNPPAWTATTSYTIGSASDASVGSWVRPTTQNRRWYRCVITGDSAASEPSWNTTVGGLTTDNGGDRWITINAFVLSGTVTAVSSNQLFADSSITESDDFWKYGKVLWLSGANQGYQMEIKGQTGTAVELYLPMVNAIGVGDTFTIYAGCAKTKAACKDKFGNIYNGQAEWDKPSRKIITRLGRR